MTNNFWILKYSTPPRYSRPKCFSGSFFSSLKIRMWGFPHGRPCSLSNKFLTCDLYARIMHGSISARMAGATNGSIDIGFWDGRPNSNTQCVKVASVVYHVQKLCGKFGCGVPFEIETSLLEENRHFGLRPCKPKGSKLMN